MSIVLHTMVIGVDVIRQRAMTLNLDAQQWRGCPDPAKD